MKKAIITGATGLVGMAVAKYLAEIGIEVLCIGRKVINPNDTSSIFGLGASYLRLDMADIASLEERVCSLGWSPGAECVFFNFAWSGDNKLTDGSFEKQLSNAISASTAIKTAKKLGCIKFVNLGTLEETFLEQFINNSDNYSYQASQSNYALAKIASRNLCTIVAYLEKIDYVHTRLSVPLAPDLSRGNYIAATLKKIIVGEPYVEPTNTQLFDIISLDDLAKAFHLIGLNGKNKADYFIGTSRLITLGELFEIAKGIVNGNYSDKPDISAAADLMSFHTEDLHRDTGFVATLRLEDIIHRLVNV